jgi:hypothetical protein
MISDTSLKGLVVVILDCHGNGGYLKALGISRKWLEQNHPEPVVVGLSDEQVESLTDYIGWLKTQTFTQPQQFQPNWDDAPEWAEYFIGEFYSEKDVPPVREDTPIVIKRPKPTPLVEVGQVWYYGAIESTIVEVTDTEVAIKNNQSSKLAVMDLSEFLSKFDCYAPSL